ncbi:MAG: hypothetical protein ABT940_07005 [Alphaproteobacteria bacterium]
MAWFAFGGGDRGPSRWYVAMSYLGILCFIPLLNNRDDEFVEFHAKQGLVLWLVAMLAILCLGIPGVGPLAFNVAMYVVPAFSLVGLAAVAMNKAVKLPGVYQLGLRL